MALPRSGTGGYQVRGNTRFGMQNGQPFYNSMGASGSYMNGLRGAASIAADGGPAPTYRAGQQILTPSQQRQLAGAAAPPPGTPAGWTAEGAQQEQSAQRPQVVQSERGEAFGIPGYNNGFGGLSRFYSGSKTDSGTLARGQNEGLALVRDKSLANKPDFANGPQYVAARQRKQDQADGRLLANAQRYGFPASMPNIQAAIGRQADSREGSAVAKALGKMELARQSQLSDAIHQAHLAHAATLRPKDQIAYLQGLLKQPAASVASPSAPKSKLGLKQVKDLTEKELDNELRNRRQEAGVRQIIGGGRMGGYDHDRPGI